MAGPALVSAAPAPLQTGYGAVVGDLVPTTGAVQPTAAFNFSAAFDIWARNTGPSNISKLFLTGISNGSLQGGHADAGRHQRHAARPDRARMTSSSSAAGRTAFLPEPPSRFGWSSPRRARDRPCRSISSGAPPDTSAARTRATATPSSRPTPSALNGDLTKFNGGYLATGDSVIVATSAALNRNNPQSTKITAPETGIPVSAAEDSNISQCTALFGNDCFGQASVLNVNNGQGLLPAASGSTSSTTRRSRTRSSSTSSTTAAPSSSPPARPRRWRRAHKVTTQGNTTFVTLFLTQNGKTFGH